MGERRIADFYSWGIALALLALACSSGGPSGEALFKLQDNLGDHHHPITTANPVTQTFFDQGLTLTFGFNHEAAVLAFQEAARLDPDCAMCFWGVALALGPNINAPMGPEAAAGAFEAITLAKERAAGAGVAEQAYIAALESRYSRDPDADRATLDRRYADAMRKLHGEYPDDIDATTLFAEALMDLTPWDYWTDDGEPRADTEEVLALLEEVLVVAPYHPGANHFYIHALEEFDPERAESAADRLVEIAPDAGHLVHMPSHIYWRVGRYNDAADINERAVAADEAFLAWCRSADFYAAGYYTHNIHFLWSAAMASGQRESAITSGLRLASKIPLEYLPAFPFLQDFLVAPILTSARFARWDEILGTPAPPEDQPFVIAVWHYARGLAFARKGQVDEAATELRAVDAALADADLSNEIFDVAGNTAGQRLSVGRAHLAAEIALVSGKPDAAISLLRDGVAAQDAMNYIEPPAWYLPTRQALGAVLLEQERFEEAEAVLRKSLEYMPRNGWALRGLANALRAQGRDVDAQWVERGFEKAWAAADTALEGPIL